MHGYRVFILSRKTLSTVRPTTGSDDAVVYTHTMQSHHPHTSFMRLFQRHQHQLPHRLCLRIGIKSSPGHFVEGVDKESAERIITQSRKLGLPFPSQWQPVAHLKKKSTQQDTKCQLPRPCALFSVPSLVPTPTNTTTSSMPIDGNTSWMVAVSCDDDGVDVFDSSTQTSAVVEHKTVTNEHVQFILYRRKCQKSPSGADTKDLHYMFRIRTREDTRPYTAFDTTMSSKIRCGVLGGGNGGTTLKVKRRRRRGKHAHPFRRTRSVRFSQFLSKQLLLSWFVHCWTSTSPPLSPQTHNKLVARFQETNNQQKYTIIFC